MRILFEEAGSRKTIESKHVGPGTIKLSINSNNPDDIDGYTSINLSLDEAYGLAEIITSQISEISRQELKKLPWWKRLLY